MPYGAIKAYTDAYLHRVDTGTHPRFKIFYVHEANDKTAHGVVEGVAFDIKYKNIFRDTNRSPLTRSVLVKLLGEANET